MKKLKEPPTFVFGLIFGTLVGLLLWYWYKSTSAEDGALDLLDRMKAADDTIRHLEERLRVETVNHYITLAPDGDNLPPFLADEKQPDLAAAPAATDLQRVKGIGPVFAQKLQAAAVDTVAELTAVSPPTLADILAIPESRAASILAEAHRMQ